MRDINSEMSLLRGRHYTNTNWSFVKSLKLRFADEDYQPARHACERILFVYY